MESLEEGAFERVMETVVIESKKLKARGWEVYLAHLAEQSMEVKARELYSHERSVTTTAALRVLLDGRMGFSYATQLDSESIRRAIDHAVRSARCMDMDDHYRFPKQTQDPMPTLDLYDRAVPETPDHEKVELATSLESAALKSHRTVRRVRKSAYEELFGTVYLANSNGLQLSYSKTYCSLSVMAVAEKGPESESAWDFEFSTRIDDLDPDRLGRRVGERAVERLSSTVPATRTCPAIIENRVAAEFLSLLAPSFLAENIFKKKSLWDTGSSRPIMSKRLSIIDSGFEIRGANSSPFDGEGIFARRTPVVERGILRGVLCDTYWGSRLGLPSTGNARRPGAQAPPALSTSNVFIEAGVRSLSKLCGDCENGVLITEVVGLHTADPISGEFSLGAMGREIRKGKRTGALRGFGIAGNLKSMFERVSAVGNDLRFMGSVGSPSLLVDNLQISGN